MDPYAIIVKKRDGLINSAAEIGFIVDKFTRGELLDGQMAAWLMASAINGLNGAETVDLTLAMIASGEQVDLSGLASVAVDKHSTGGVGDKTTLVAVPLAATAGVIIPKLSGRSLGHTGGTLDKIESIPGFRASLTVRQIFDQVNRVGAAIAAQTDDLVPADKKIYALRDVTATVESIPLIAASVISKKAAGGARRILIDVKTGTGSFMESRQAARELASSLTATGEALGLTVRCLITDMNQPLGSAVGNALEVREAIECLRGAGPADLRALSIRLAAEMLIMADPGIGASQAEGRIGEILDSGAALEKFGQIIAAQGGDSRVIDDPDILPSAGESGVINASRSGFFSIINCRDIGRAAALLYYGPGGKSDAGAGILMRAGHGDKVLSGDPLIELRYSSGTDVAEPRAMLSRAIEVVRESPVERTLIYQD